MSKPPHPWFFYYRQSALWWERGEKALLFKGPVRSKEGAVPVCIRTAPFDVALPGPLSGARDTEHGWRDHPATKAAESAYGALESA